MATGQRGNEVTNFEEICKSDVKDMELSEGMASSVLMSIVYISD